MKNGFDDERPSQALLFFRVDAQLMRLAGYKWLLVHGSPRVRWYDGQVECTSTRVTIATILAKIVKVNL